MIVAVLVFDMKNQNVPCAKFSYFTLNHAVNVRKFFACNV
jgi:hypothetical protein